MKQKGENFLSMLKFLILGYFISGLLLLLLALFLYKWDLPKPAINAGVIVVYVLSVFGMGFVAGKVKQRRKFLWGLLLGGAYFCILACISFILVKSPCHGGNVITTLCLCLGGGMLGGMLS